MGSADPTTPSASSTTTVITSPLPGPAAPPVKAGWKTTEFWVTLIGIGAGLSGLVPAGARAAIVAVATAAYAVSRAIVKAFGGAAPPAALVLAALLAGSCATTTPGAPPTTGGKVISCAGNAIASCAPQALGSVNECLIGSGDVTACLLGLIPKGGACFTYDVIACLVQHEGSAAAADAQANPDDTRAARRAALAKEFLQGQGITFAGS